MPLLYIFLMIFLSVSSCENGGGSTNANGDQGENTSAHDSIASGEAKRKEIIHTIAFYNVENLFDTIDDKRKNDNAFLPSSKKAWDSQRYAEKLDNLAKVIAELGDEDGPEVLGVCEVENRVVLEELVAHPDLNKLAYGIAHIESPDFRGIDVALLYKKDVFKTDTVIAHPIFYEDGREYRTRHILEVRGMMGKADETISFFIGHFPSRIGGKEKTEYKRVLVAKHMRAAIDTFQMENPAGHVVAMGDFNDYPTDQSLLLGLEADSVWEEGNLDLMNLSYALMLDSLGTYDYRGNWEMLDHIAVSSSLKEDDKGLDCMGCAAKVYKQEWMLQQEPEKYKGTPWRTYAGKKYLGGYSDYLPIYMKVRECR